MTVQRLLATITVATALTGCTTGLIAPIKQDIQARDVEAQDLLTQARQGPGAIQAQKSSSVERIEALWLPTRKAAELAAQSASIDASERRYASNRSYHSIQEVAERITALTGIPVSVAPDAQMPIGDAASSMSGTVGQGSTSSAPKPPLPALPNFAPLGQMPGGGQLGGVNLVYDGTLKGFLDVAAARFGVSWEWTGSSYNLFRYTTQTWQLKGIPGDTTLQRAITSQTGGATGGSSGSGNDGSATGGNAISGGGSSTTSTSFSNMSIWKAIEQTLDKMSSTKKYSVTPATGTASATDTPQNLARMHAFIESQNASLSKQVNVNVRVLAVDLSDDDQYGINWNALYSSLSGNLSLGLTNAFAADPSATSLTLKVLGGGTNKSPWAGSQAILSALSKQGNVSQITSATLTTLNNQPAPLQIGRQTSYLASSTTTVTQGAGSTTTMQPGLVSTGFSMSLVPHILDKGEMMLQFSIDISSLLKLNEITSGDATIQMPDVDTRNFLQRVKMNSGETLVLTGFEQSNQSTSQQGVGSASNVALGGGVAGKKGRTVLVILIQPILGDA
ncbi:PilN family type IVB pilus formation outer membrane protein [Glaciimonas sp. GG7]